MTVMRLFFPNMLREFTEDFSKPKYTLVPSRTVLHMTRYFLELDSIYRGIQASWLSSFSISIIWFVRWASASRSSSIFLWASASIWACFSSRSLCALHFTFYSMAKIFLTSSKDSSTCKQTSLFRGWRMSLSMDLKAHFISTKPNLPSVDRSY